MTGDKMTETSMAPVHALVMGGGTGDGGSETSTIQTPAGQPNLVVTYVSQGIGIFARTVAAFIGSILALLAAGPATGIITAQDFLGLLAKCASLSLAVGAVALGKDLVVLFTSIGNKFPLMRA